MPAYLGVRNECRDFFVVFAPTAFRRIWSPFCAKNFKHCWVFWPNYLGTPGLMTPRNTIKVEAQSSNIDIDVWYADPLEVAESFLPLSTDILRISLPFKTSFTYRPRGIITCVSIVKAVMDLKATWVLTPEQLHRHLLKIRAVSLKGGKDNGNRYHQLVQTSSAGG